MALQHNLKTLSDTFVWVQRFKYPAQTANVLHLFYLYGLISLSPYLFTCFISKFIINCSRWCLSGSLYVSSNSNICEMTKRQTLGMIFERSRLISAVWKRIWKLSHKKRIISTAKSAMKTMRFKSFEETIFSYNFGYP